MSEWRPEVVAFANLMEAQLRANDHKPGWKNDLVQDLGERLEQECDELSLATRALNITRCAEGLANVGREAADVANFAMMIADVCGALSNPPEPS